MAILDGYDATDRARIKAIAIQLVEGGVASGEIECTSEAIKAAMPQAFADAKAAVSAANEYLCG
jgi:hypothetical protein